MKPDWRLARLRAELKRYDLLRRGVRGLRVLRGRHLADVWRIEAPEARTGKPLSMLFVGEPVTRHYLSGLVYEKYRDAWGRTILPRGALVPGTRLLGRRCDLLVHESAMPAPGALPGGAFWIPNWVGGEIEFAEAERLKKTSGRLQADLRRLRKLPHRVHTTRAPSEIYRFYCEFYEPYIRSTFGACACLSSWEEVEARLPQSELFWIMRDGERLAGQIVLYEPERVRAWCLGVKSGARELVRAGVIAALYQAEIQHLAGNGYTRLHVGASRPFLTDGVLRFKRKWGMRLVDHSDRGLLLTVRRASEPLRAFLAGHPFVSLGAHGKMQASALVGGARSGEPGEPDRELLPPELGRPFLYELEDGGAVEWKGLAPAA
ncbi:hypothetical protein SVA_1536 [Sulfurifustis variabilis]|uniref:BioF2-like acetyltransferase domain-containing protein n=1 Tax=Sulfurifustis variabilis TaxID=1675686 RepID=A0A1B4V3G5_9GAMM|nr:hypothetical protein [Sulfurifustis variabilis]BAU48098.1 hypothetical protein SVA_1536 [Sulfurifustis variabilis]